MLSRKLEAIGDAELAALLESRAPLHAGVGGRSRMLNFEGESIFVKQIPLTALERRPEHARSTENLFHIPLECHYGLGGPGFSGWRELACNELATGWALSGACTNFPLLYHARVLNSERRPLDGDVDFWLDFPAVRARLEAIADAESQIVLFTEYIPQNLQTWLNGQLALSAESAAAAIAFVDEHLTKTINFMNTRGLVHFDAHFENILTDGERLYFADFGLALSSEFALTPEELEFLERNQNYDFDRAAISYTHSIISAFLGRDRWKEKLREQSATPTLPTPIAAALQRQAPRALALLDFVAALREKYERPGRG